MYKVLAAWTVTPVLLWGPGFEAQPAADDPPFGARPWVEGVIASWTPEPPIFQGRRYFPQGGVVVDDPPFGAHTFQPTWVPDWTPPERRRFVPQGAVAPAVTQPAPFRWVAQVVGMWEPVPGQAQPRARVQIPTPDLPPFGDTRPWVATVLGTWEPEAQTQRPRTLAPQVAQAAADNPPFGQRPWQSRVLEQWQPEVPRTSARAPQPPATPDLPPFGERPWVAPVLASWIQEWPVSQRPIRVVQGFVTPAENPPFGMRPWQPAVREMWEPPAYRPQVLSKIPQAARADQPPGPDSWVQAVLAQWEPPWPRTQERRLVAATIVNDPPFGAKPWVARVVSMWEPVRPEQVIHRYVTEGSAFVAPVFGWGARGQIGGVGRDPWSRIGTEVAPDQFGRIGTEVAPDPNKKIGGETA